MIDAATNPLALAICEQTERALWSVGNVLAAIPGPQWDEVYCGMPLWKHVYHMLHSLDRWLLDPGTYEEPPFHTQGLDDLDTPPDGERFTKAALLDYFDTVQEKTASYVSGLEDAALADRPPGCRWSRFELILAQHRHLHTHMGMLMGFVVSESGKWPRVAGLEDSVPPTPDSLYF